MKDIRGRFIKCLELFVNQQCAYFTYILSNKSINNIYNSILKIYHSERARISETMQALGEPAIWGTENTSCFTFLKNNETSQVPTFKLFAYELVNEFLGVQDGKCPLKELCDQDKNIQKKYECVSNPLMIDNHCPMYFASRMVGINNKEICASDDSNR